MKYSQVIQNTPIGDVKNLYYCSSLPIVREKLDYFLLQQECCMFLDAVSNFTVPTFALFINGELAFSLTLTRHIALLAEMLFQEQRKRLLLLP